MIQSAIFSREWLYGMPYFFFLLHALDFSRFCGIVCQNVSVYNKTENVTFMPRNQFFSKFVSKLDAMDSGSINSYVHLLAREHGFMESVFNAIREGIIIIDDTYNLV